MRSPPGPQVLLDIIRLLLAASPRDNHSLVSLTRDNVYIEPVYNQSNWAHLLDRSIIYYSMIKLSTSDRPAGGVDPTGLLVRQASHRLDMLNHLVTETVAVSHS